MRNKAITMRDTKPERVLLEMSFCEPDRRPQLASPSEIRDQGHEVWRDRNWIQLLLWRVPSRQGSCVRSSQNWSFCSPGIWLVFHKQDSVNFHHSHMGYRLLVALSKQEAWVGKSVNDPPKVRENIGSQTWNPHFPPTWPASYLWTWYTLSCPFHKPRQGVI